MLTNEQETVNGLLRLKKRYTSAQGACVLTEQKNDEAIRTISNAIRMIDRLTADNAALREQNNRAGWVRVEDGLPEVEEGSFLVVRKWDFSPRSVEQIVYRKHGRWTDGWQILPNNITHWVPLPEPPEVQ